MSFEARVRELGLPLPARSIPGGAYVPAVQTGSLVFSAGQTPKVEGQLVMRGKLGAEVSVEQGREAACVALMNALAAIGNLTGSLDALVKIVRLTAFVASAPGFTEQQKVLEGASQLLRDIFGDAGAHARVLVGVAVLPGDAPVEVELIAEVRGREVEAPC